MTKLIIIVLMPATCQFAFSPSNAEVNNKSFAFVLKQLLSHKVPEISVAKAAASLKAYTFLDAREPEEFVISHLPNAIFIGYKNLGRAALKNVAKHKAIVVYCAMGKRSENIAMRLTKEGYTNVSNLYGGIFEWVNEGHPLYDASNGLTNKVHAYNWLWGRFLDKGEKVYEAKSPHD
jgi:rhodanese-related sulfurtransferase